jgi:hypothetical protein
VNYILCLLWMPSKAKKADRAGIVFQFCRNHVNCAHQSITVRSPSSTKPALLQAHTRQTKVTSSGCTHSSPICSKCIRASLQCLCMANPPVVHSKGPHHVKKASCWTLLQASSMLPHFAYMSTRLLLTKTADSQLLLMICSCRVGLHPAV